MWEREAALGAEVVPEVNWMFMTSVRLRGCARGGGEMGFGVLVGSVEARREEKGRRGLRVEREAWEVDVEVWVSATMIWRREGTAVEWRVLLL